MDFKEININSNYDEVLKGLIPQIKSFKFKRGSEGMAFFVGKEFVVKYYQRIDFNNELFKKHCEELKSYTNLDFSYPKLYSWAIVPVAEEDRIFNYYILQEQIKGSELYPHGFSGFENHCMSFCSKKEFNKAIEKVEYNKALYQKILEAISLIFRDINMQLVEMPEEEKIKFIKTFYYLKRNSEYSLTDLHAENVLFDGTNMTLIDNVICDRNKRQWMSYDGTFIEKRCQLSTVYDLLYLFSENRSLMHLISGYIEETKENPDKNILKLEKENKKYLSKFMVDWVKFCKEIVLSEKLINLDIDYLLGALNGLVEEKAYSSIENELCR